MAKDFEKDKDLEQEPEEEFQEFQSPDAYSFEVDSKVEDESLSEADLDYYPKEFNEELDQAAKEVEDKEKKKKAQEELIAKKEAAVMAKASKVKIKVDAPVKKKKPTKKKVKKKIVKEEVKLPEVIEEKIEEHAVEKEKHSIINGRNIVVAAAVAFIVIVMVIVFMNATKQAINQQNVEVQDDALASTSGPVLVEDSTQETEEPEPIDPTDSKIAEALFKGLKDKKS